MLGPKSDIENSAGLQKRDLAYVLALATITISSTVALAFSSTAFPWWKLILMMGAEAAACDLICTQLHTVLIQKKEPPRMVFLMLNGRGLWRQARNHPQEAIAIAVAAALVIIWVAETILIFQRKDQF